MKECILVVDDEEVNRELLQAILEREGYQVVLAPDGPGALASLEASRPDLILLDLLMPGMNGLEVCRRIKTQSSTMEIPIIIVTAVGQVVTKEAALTSGADDFLTKPVDAADLRTRIRAMLRVRQVKEELARTLSYLHELEAAHQAQREAVLAQLGPAGAPDAAVGDPGILVLVIDDDLVTRTLITDLLKAQGFRVRAAAGGPEGLAIAEAEPIQTAIVDVVMPGMSGLEVLEHLHASDPDLPVIMITGHPTSLYSLAALKMGAFDFLAKEADSAAMVLTVHRAVRDRQRVLQLKAEIRRLQAQNEALGGPRGA